MTKLEAIEYFNNPNNYSYDGIPLNNAAYNEAVDIAVDCIQHCLDEEDSPCYNCYDKHCNNCLYSGRIPE